jgi:hypothetical protein
MKNVIVDADQTTKTRNNRRRTMNMRFMAFSLT